METRYTTLAAGNRYDITVTIKRHQSIEPYGERIHRLLVADEDGDEFPIYISPARDTDLDTRTGDRYFITNLLAADPTDTAVDLEVFCPECGGQLRNGTIVDGVSPGIAQAVSEQAIETTIGILDSISAVRAINAEDESLDDWNPVNPGRDVGEPDYVCRSCNRHFGEYEIQRAIAEDLPDEFHHQELQEAAPMNNSMAAPETLGMAAGGAKDITNFRENIKNGHTPQPDAISDEGLFYDYYFETGDTTDTDSLFAPRYAAAVTEHPLTGEVEHYLSVGLDSTLSVADFERPQLNLVAVLDISGSMDSPFDQYYYDEHGRQRETRADNQSKIEAAIQSLCALTEALHPEDKLGVVLYNSRAHVAKPLREVGRTDMRAIRRHLHEIQAGGGTNLTDGFEAALDLLADTPSTPDQESRVVFMTDMMPNTGMTDEGGLTRLFDNAARDGIHTTFIGMGIDANADLIESLSGIPGANHYFVQSAPEFEQRLGDEFDYMVTPLVYDLDLEIDTNGYEIEAVHGSPSSDPAAGQLMHVGTLFPSAKQDGEARGGVVLVRLEQSAPDTDIELSASWTERDGSEHTKSVTVDMPREPETFAHDGIRKAVALSRYASELRSWATDVHERADSATGVDDWLLPDQRNNHERESVPLVVPDRFGERFDQLRQYLQDEMEAVGDDTLQRELDLLSLLRRETPTTTEVTD